MHGSAWHGDGATLLRALSRSLEHGIETADMQPRPERRQNDQLP
jgi:hypothetical protein